MQQQTRQRTRRKRKSTPLPEKRGGTRQTTRSRHANTTLRHMVNHTPLFQTIERRTVKKDEEQTREDKRRQPRNTMVFGDNVRARWAARALPRTPTRKGRGRGRGRGRQATRPHTHTTHHAPPFHNTAQHHTPHKEWTVDVFLSDTKPSSLFHNDTTLSQRHSTKPTML